MEQNRKLQKLKQDLESTLQGEIHYGAIYQTHYAKSLYYILIITRNIGEDQFFIEYMDSMHFQTNHFPLTEINMAYDAKDTLPHDQNSFLMIYMLSGDATISFGESTRHLHRGDCCLLNRNVVHYEYADGDYNIAYIALRPEFFQTQNLGSILLKKYTPTHLLSDYFTNSIKNDLKRERNYYQFIYGKQTASVGADRCRHVFANIRDELKQRSPGFELIVTGLFLRLFSILETDAGYTATYVDINTEKRKDLIQEARYYLDCHKRHVSADELATVLTVNSDYLGRIFKKYTGYTVLEYNREICMKEAARLLTHTDLSIAQIAETLGYTNQTHFYKIFRAQYATNPSEYRRESVNDGTTKLSPRNSPP